MEEVNTKRRFERKKKNEAVGRRGGGIWMHLAPSQGIYIVVTDGRFLCLLVGRFTEHF